MIRKNSFESLCLSLVFENIKNVFKLRPSGSFNKHKVKSQ